MEEKIKSIEDLAKANEQKSRENELEIRTVQGHFKLIESKLDHVNINLKGINSVLTEFKTLFATKDSVSNRMELLEAKYSPMRQGVIWVATLVAGAIILKVIEKNF